jgi:uncharacterized hydrophobic protein (TIGR00271 family)
MFHLPYLHEHEQSLTEASKNEIRQTVHNLILLSTNDYGYYLFLVLSILITTAGLLLSSVPVIIGGMIIAPVLIPILGCGLAILLVEMKGIVRSAAIIVLSAVIALILSTVMTMITLIAEPVTVIVDYGPHTINPGLYFVIAFCSGVAGAFAFVKEHLSSSISGVAVSASLVPPLCRIGIGIALKNPVLAEESFRVFALNVVGIIVASILVFWILGFRSARKLEEDIVEEVENSE